MSKLSMFAFAVGSVLAMGCGSKEPIDKAIAGMEDFKAKMCACKDKACADKVNEDMAKWGPEMAKNAGTARDAKPDPEAAKKSAEIMTRYTECMTKLMMAGMGEPSTTVEASDPLREP